MKVKKGAMFGLEARELRKQSGRLFLARLRRLTFRLVEGQQATRVLTAKGAMFGLDARIALAIFGALSVISGAALYSAIQEAKVTSTITELEEIGKALEAHYIDTTIWATHNSPSSLPTEAQFYDLRLNSLNQSNGTKRWNGPYISGFANGSGVGIKKGDYDFGLVMNVPEDSSWGDSTPWWNHTTSFCISGRACNLWIVKFYYEDSSLLKAMDEKVDSSDGATLGKVKWYKSGSGFMLFYRLNPIKNPND